MSKAETTLETKIEDLCSEISEIRLDLYDIADDATDYRDKIDREELDWVRLNPLIESYEIWYNDAATLIGEYLPRRQPDFDQSYQEIHNLVRFDSVYEIDIGLYKGIVNREIKNQTSLLKSIPRKLDTERLKVTKSVSEQIVNDEILEAKRMWDDDNIRAAGVVGGVALERHLFTLCELSEQEFYYNRSDSIMQLATALEKVGEIEDARKSQIEYLSKIRNKCAHDDGDEPERREVEQLLNQVEEIVTDHRVQ